VLELLEGASPNCHFGDNIGLTTVGGCAGSATGDLFGVRGSETLPGVRGSDTAEGADVVARSLVSLVPSWAGWCS
jgi:hypothetical protein